MNFNNQTSAAKGKSVNFEHPLPLVNTRGPGMASPSSGEASKAMKNGFKKSGTNNKAAEFAKQVRENNKFMDS